MLEDKQLPPGIHFVAEIGKVAVLYFFAFSKETYET